MVADPDTNSKVEGKDLWRSYLLKGHVTVVTTSSSGYSVSVTWDKDLVSETGHLGKLNSLSPATCVFYVYWELCGMSRDTDQSALSDVVRVGTVPLSNLIRSALTSDPSRDQGS